MKLVDPKDALPIINKMDYQDVVTLFGHPSHTDELESSDSNAYLERVYPEKVFAFGLSTNHASTD